MLSKVHYGMLGIQKEYIIFVYRLQETQKNSATLVTIENRCGVFQR